MRIPLTRYGLPEVVVYPAAIVVLMAAIGWLGPMFVPMWAATLTDGVLALVLVWALMFFRDPRRQTPQDDRLWFAPADGTVMDIERVDGPQDRRSSLVSRISQEGDSTPRDTSDEIRATQGQDALATEFIGGPALRIGIFLSIFNTHINRAPCDARVEKITYRRGKFLNAMNPLAGKINESNDLAMVRLPSLVSRPSSLASDGAVGATPCGCPRQAQGRGVEDVSPSNRGQDARSTCAPACGEPRATSDELRATKFVVRQISGAIARRIVCAAREGQQLAQGQRFGMIKFGSRTELYVPANEGIECVVRIGDRVQAGITPVARYVKRET